MAQTSHCTTAEMKNPHQSAQRSNNLRVFPPISRGPKDGATMTKTEKDEQGGITSMGVLLAGIAHELNNPLTGIVVNLELARLSLDQSQIADLKELLEEASSATQRVRRIVQEMGLLSPGQEVAPGAFTLQSLLEWGLKVTANQLRYRAQIQRDYQETPKLVGKEQRLWQALLHLLTSVVQSIPEGDPSSNTLQVSTSNSHDGRASVSVSYDGALSEEGLIELSLCRCLVESMQGEIVWRSEPGQGTRVQLWLPAAEAR